jgi:hypothetical protein
MEKYYKDFSDNFMALISEIHLYSPSNTTEKLIKSIGKLDVASISKIIARFNIIANKYKTLIENRNENLFINSMFNPIPELNFSSFWNDLLPEQKERIWIYLQLLTFASNFIMNFVNSKQSNDNSIKSNDNSIKSNDNSIKSNDNSIKSNEFSIKSNDNSIKSNDNSIKSNDKDKKKLTFNPYDGIGAQTNEFSMDTLLSGPKDLPSDESKSNNLGLGNLSSMLNLGKMFDMNTLANELKNIDISQIEQATNNIKDLLGDNLDKETSEMISDMVTDITDELKKVPETDASGNPLEKLFKIAESVAGKIGPKMKNKNIDIKKLWESAQNLTNKFGDVSNNNGFNPMSLVNNLMGQTMKMQENFQGKTNEECIAECEKMMESSGLGNLMKMMPKLSSQLNQPHNNTNNPTKERLQKKLEQKNKKQ